MRSQLSKKITRGVAVMMAVTMCITAVGMNPDWLKAAKAVKVKTVSIMNPNNVKALVLKKGGSYKIKTSVSVTPNKAANKKVTFKSSKSKVASVSKSGVIKALKNGKTNITVVSSKDKKKKAILAVVVGTPIKKMAIDTTAVLSVEETKQLNVTYSPKNASVKAVKWASSDTSIATVSGGKVVAKAAGTAKITATAADGSGKKAVCTITVQGKPEPTVAPTAEPTVTPEPEKNYSIQYGSPVVDGDIDAIWDGVPELKAAHVNLAGETSTTAEGTFKVMWDDNALYVLAQVKDDALSTEGTSSAKQDAVDVYMDENNDRAEKYSKADDVIYRVNCKNVRSCLSGPNNRLYSQTKTTEDGYLVEMCIRFNNKSQNNKKIGLEMRINDAKGGKLIASLNVIDSTNTVATDQSKLGTFELIGRPDVPSTYGYQYELVDYLSTLEKITPTNYTQEEQVIEELKKARELLNNQPNQKAIDDKMVALKSFWSTLTRHELFAEPKDIEVETSLPDIFSFYDGTKVTKQNWLARKEEIKNLYQFYMYGMWRDGTGENLSYQLNGDKTKMSLMVTRDALVGPQAKYDVTITIPSGTAPEGGWPVIVAFGSVGQSASYAVGRGYATINVPYTTLAADNSSRTGQFYNIYPYGTSWKDQTGALMAWAWGASKVLDALEQGAGEELNISTENTVITGVSRCGKAAAVAGAFEERFKMTMPVCSGYGGLTMSRYYSNGQTYDLSMYTGDPKESSVADLSKWTISGGNEALGGLQSEAEGHWFNSVFLEFKSYQHIPFDQHFLASLCTDENRYMYMVTGLNSDMWNSPPGLFYTYEETKEVYKLLEITDDNLAIHMHLNLHGIEKEDLEYGLDYMDYHVYGKTPTKNLSDMKKCPFSKEVSRSNYEVYEEAKAK